MQREWGRDGKEQRFCACQVAVLLQNPGRGNEACVKLACLNHLLLTSILLPQKAISLPTFFNLLVLLMSRAALILPLFSLGADAEVCAGVLPALSGWQPGQNVWALYPPVET